MGSQLTTIRTTCRILQKLRQLVDADLSVQKALTLLLISANEGLSQVELAKLAKTSRAATSKNVLDLTAVTSRKSRGPGLVEQRQDPMERRVNRLFLTAKGTKALKEVFS